MNVHSESSQGSEQGSPAQSDDERSIQSRQSGAESAGGDSAQSGNEDSDQEEGSERQSPAQSVEGSPNTQGSDVESDRPHSEAASEGQASDQEASDNDESANEEDNQARSERVEQEDSENEYASPRSGHGSPQSGHGSLQSGHGSPQSGQGSPRSGGASVRSGGASVRSGGASVRSEEPQSGNEQSDQEDGPQHHEGSDSEYHSEEAQSADEKDQREPVSDDEQQSDQKSEGEDEEDRRPPLSSDDEQMDREDDDRERKVASSPEQQSHSEAEDRGSDQESDDQQRSEAEEDVKSPAEVDESVASRKLKRSSTDDDQEENDNVKKRKISMQDDLFSAEESENEEERTKRQHSDDSEAGSGNDVVRKRKKRSRVESDDDEGSRHGSDTAVRDASREGSEDETETNKDKQDKSDNEENQATVHDLFGEDLSSDEEGKKQTDGETVLKNGHAEPMLHMMQDDEEAEEPPKETKILVEIPHIAANLGKEINFIKMPNFLSVDTRPFDPVTYEDEIDEEEGLDEEGRARLKLKVENTIRWKEDFDDDGNAIKESNARIVKWSDGSFSLHLGSEIFDVYRQTLIQGDHNHLFVRQGTGLQGQSVFRTKLTFRPHSTDSFTHRKMTLSLADRNQKTQKIRVLPTVGQDPEAHRSEMIKKEEDRLKASIRRESKQRRMKEKSHTRGLNASYLENDNYEDEDGAISLNAIKNRYKKGGAALSKSHIYSSDEDVSDDEKAKRLEDAKADDDDDSDLDYFDRKNADGKKKSATAIEESDEESS